MADNTKIEWADATLNYVNGCSVHSPGCTNCYAMRLAGTRLKHHPTRAGLTTDTKAGPVWTGEVRENSAALEQALRWKKPRAIFWNAHGDLFHENVPDEWIDRQFAVMALTPQHRHMVLTKRSDRMRNYVAAHRWQDVLDWQYEYQAGGLSAATPVGEAWPLPNVWLGVSVEDQRRADERIPDLLATPAAIRFISAEPLLGPVDLRSVGENINAVEGYKPIIANGLVHDMAFFRKLDWVIVGGESGPGARPMHPDWARSLRDQCANAGVRFHFKQWGEWANAAMRPSGTPGNFAIISDRHDEFARTSYLDHYPRQFLAFGSTVHERVGKARAGRLLDGVEHNGLPG